MRLKSEWRSDSFCFSLQDLMQQNDIGYVLNASNTCPKPDFIPESHFLRVPVNDSFCEKILPWLDRSVEFIGQQPFWSFLSVPSPSCMS